MQKPATKIVLPPCGILLGHGIYNYHGIFPFASGGWYQNWASQRMSPLELVEETVRENQGNLMQFWWFKEPDRPLPLSNWLAMEDLGFKCPEPDWTSMKNLSAEEFPELLARREDRAGAGVLKALEACEKHGLYSTMIYLDGVNPKYSRRFTDCPHYIGYDFGERFTFRYHSDATTAESPRLDLLAADFTERVRAHVRECREKGFGLISCTSSNFYMDYEVAAGVDYTLFEDLTTELNVVSSFSRGLARQYGRDIWGSHIANEYYSWLSGDNPQRGKTLFTQMAMKYMAGAKVIISESGAWHVQAPRAGGSPNGKLIPRQPGPFGSPIAPDAEQAEIARVVESVRDQLDDRSEWCRSYRRQMSDFYDYVKANGTPPGQPETTFAVAKGNYDLSDIGMDCGLDSNAVIAGLHGWAEKHMEWMNGAPEAGWSFAEDIFWPRPQGIYGNDDYNRYFSGTPYGQIDVVSFAYDQPSAEFLLANYKSLAFLGWNTCSEKQYKVLCDYVKGGGRLFISIPHLSTDLTRNYCAYTVDDLVNRGDFTELCGVRVKGRGPYFYWATRPNRSGYSGKDDAMPWGYYRISGAYRGLLGDIEISAPGAEEILRDIETDTGILYRIPSGKGEVWFVNSWFYPGAYRRNYGTGGWAGDTGFVGDVLKYLAKTSRGKVFITECGSDSPGPECRYINYSYFPSNGIVLLLNIDFTKHHSCDLHIGGRVVKLDLRPNEFARFSACGEQEAGEDKA